MDWLTFTYKHFGEKATISIIKKETIDNPLAQMLLLQGVKLHSV